MENKLYLVKFADGTFTTTRVKPRSGDYGKGARFFFADPEITLEEISEFLGYDRTPEGLEELRAMVPQ